MSWCFESKQNLYNLYTENYKKNKNSQTQLNIDEPIGGLSFFYA